MNKLTRFFVLLLSSLFIFSSCSSVYIDPVVTTSGEEIISDEEEYFTPNTVSTQGDSADYYWNGYWLYFESQNTIAQTGTDANGEPVYGDSTISRLVKYNPATGQVSSVCLDPSCNHSYESGCFTVVPHSAGPKAPRVSVRINGICGDWVMIMVSAQHEEYSSTNELKAYNMKTGELRILSGEELGGEVMVRWTCRATFGNKLYRIKNILDYSNTKYTPGGEGENVLDYTPETTCILYEYDFETNTDTELFEVPSDYDGICAVSNKRFFFQKTEGEIYSCKRDGSEWKKEDVLNFAPFNFFGSLAFIYLDGGEYTVYDLKTDQLTTVTPEFDAYGYPTLVSDGVIFSNAPAYAEARAARKEYEDAWRRENPELSSSEISQLWAKKYQEILLSGTSQIWKCDMYGNSMSMVCEIQNTLVDLIFAVDQYVLAKISYLKESSDNEAEKVTNRCVIDLETGEFSELPLLDVVIPPEYLN